MVFLSKKLNKTKTKQKKNKNNQPTKKEWPVHFFPGSPDQVTYMWQFRAAGFVKATVKWLIRQVCQILFIILVTFNEGVRHSNRPINFNNLPKSSYEKEDA